MRVVKYIEPGPYSFAGPPYPHHVMECDHCGFRFGAKVVGVDRLRCPRCLVTVDAGPVIDEWQKHWKQP